MKQILWMLLSANSISKTSDESLKMGVVVMVISIIIAFIVAIMLVESGV